MTKTELKKYSEFNRVRQTIKNISKDDSKIQTEKVYFLSNDTRMAIDFDKVKTKYLNSIELTEEYAASVDALFQDAEGKIYFVEFKNGSFKPEEIKRKAKDSILIFSDITKNTIAYTREDAVFVLVVSDEKIDKLPTQEKRAIALANKGGVDFAMWGLDKLRGYCFKQVKTMSASSFDKWICKIDIE